MKTLKLIIPVFSILLLMSCGESSKNLTVKTETYCDHCETCESCKAKVETALKATSGVNSAEMKVSAQTISVNYVDYNRNVSFPINKIKNIKKIGGFYKIWISRKCMYINIDSFEMGNAEEFYNWLDSFG